MLLISCQSQTYRTVTQTEIEIVLPPDTLLRPCDNIDQIAYGSTVRDVIQHYIDLVTKFKKCRKQVELLIEWETQVTDTSN